MPQFDDLDTLGGLTTEVARVSALIDEGLAAMRHFAAEYADAEAGYRKGKATAWVTVRASLPPGDKTLADELKARVEDATADLRHRRDLAEAMKQTALEAVRSRRGQLSALQTLGNAHREEVALGRTGPEHHP